MNRLLFSLGLLIACCNWPLAVDAEDLSVDNRYPLATDADDRSGLMAKIMIGTAIEVEAALRRAEQLFESGAIQAGTQPAKLVLDGPEVALFLRENYQQNKSLIDLAARLAAFKVVDIKVCEMRLDLLGRSKQDIYPFVGTVPFGPSEKQQLHDDGYQYF